MQTRNEFGQQPLKSANVGLSKQSNIKWKKLNDQNLRDRGRFHGGYREERGRGCEKDKWDTPNENLKSNIS